MYQEYGTIFSYIIGIVLLFFMGKFFVLPMKIVIKLLFNSILGAIIIFIINFIGGFFDYNIALNFITTFIVGILGVPGLLLIVALKYVFNV